MRWPAALTPLLFFCAAPLASCSDDENDNVYRSVEVWAVAGGTKEIGKPYLVAASALREVRNCNVVNNTPVCQVTEHAFLDMAVVSATCTIGGCDVRRVALDEVRSEATDAFFKADSAPPPEHTILFQVTPRTPDATFNVQGNFDGSTATSSGVGFSSIRVTGLDIAAWRVPYRAFIANVDPITLLPGAKVTLHCPELTAAYEGKENFTPSLPFPVKPDELEVEVVGQGVTATANPNDCQAWLDVRAESAGAATILIKRGELTASLSMRVASVSDVRAFTMHEHPVGSPMIAFPVTQEVTGTQELLGFGCVLDLTDGSRAFGGCGTLQANPQSGLERLGSPTASPESEVYVGFKRVTKPQAGGEIRGRVGAVELVVPVR